MAPQARYDSEWEEVKVINAFVVLTVYVSFAMKGVGYLVIMWTTVVLLGGFVAVIDNADFWRLTLITLMQILWMHSPSLIQKLLSIGDLLHRLKTVNNMLKRSWVQADNPGADDPGQPVIVAVVGFVLTLIHIVVLYMFIAPLYYAVVYGMFISTWISIRGLMQHDYDGHITDAGRTNIATAHNVLHALCVVQGALWFYKLILVRSEKQIVEQVSRAYGFEDGGRAILAYLVEIKRGYNNSPPLPKARNLITYAVDLMASKDPTMCLSGTLILDKLLTRHPNLVYQQYQQNHQPQQLEDMTRSTHLNTKEKIKEGKHQQLEEEIISCQRKVIKGLIGSASYTHVLQKLFEALDPKSSYDRKMRDASARIVESVADMIRLEQFPRGVHCISSLLTTFKEYHRLQPDQSALTSNKSKNDTLHGYKELVLAGLCILQMLARSMDNNIIISNTKNLVSKIMAPVSYDLVHRTHHSVWSTRVVEASLGVILELMDSDGDTGAKMLIRILSDDKAMATMERIVRCEECKGVDLQVKTMVILTKLLCKNGETDTRVNFTKMLLSIFTSGTNTNVLIRMTAGHALEMFYFGNTSAYTAHSTENNDASEFVGGLVNIASQVGVKNTCRKFAVEILERLCIFYTENNKNLSTLKKSMTCVMPTVLREILLVYCLIGEGNTAYSGSSADVESQAPIDGKSDASQVHNNKNNNNTSSALKEKQELSLHVALLSLCLTACEKLHLEFYTMNPMGDSAALCMARKMVQLNSDLSLECLAMMKLTTRMVIEMMKHTGVMETTNLDLESLMNSISSVSETMLDLESSMVFATNIHDTSRTLDSLVREARDLHNKDKEQDMGIV